MKSLSISTLFVVMTISPPPGMASRELVARLTSTWPNCPGSAITSSGSLRGSTLRATVGGKSLPTTGCISLTMVFRSTVRNSMRIFRLNASREPVRFAARSAAATMFPTSGDRLGSSIFMRSTLENPIMAVRILLKSWAIPPHNVPSASIFWVW